MDRRTARRMSLGTRSAAAVRYSVPRTPRRGMGRPACRIGPTRRVSPDQNRRTDKRVDHVEPVCGPSGISLDITAGGDDTVSVDLSPLNGSAPYAIAYAFENQKDTCCNAGADPGEHDRHDRFASAASRWLRCHTVAVLQTSPMVSSSARRPPALSSCRTLARRSARCRRTRSSQRSRMASVSA